MKPIFNTLEFDGIKSIDQDIYITGKSPYNTPERDVEFVEIAGRSGDYALDKGRWKNVEITYTAGAFGEDQDEFAAKVRQFRNQLTSRYGYHRLVDTYNPEEYRLAIFKNPIEVDTEGRKRAGEFDLVFNCQPQRYLMSGESEISVSSGEKLYNPTPYDAKPLLAVKGYGTIEFNGYTIELDDGFIGSVKVVDGEVWDPIESQSSSTIVNTYSNSIDYSEFSNSVNAGDDMTVSYAEINTWCHTSSSSISIVSGSGGQIYANGALSTNKFTDIAFTAFPNTNQTQTSTVSMKLTLSNSSTTTITTTFTMVNKPSGVIEFSAETSMSPDITQYLVYSLSSFLVRDATIDSTVSLIGDPTYIDCDLGDAYMIKDGTYIGLNRYIDLGSDLPTLASGNNEITFDNTVTELVIKPRWWIL